MERSRKLWFLENPVKTGINSAIQWLKRVLATSSKSQIQMESSVILSHYTWNYDDHIACRSQNTSESKRGCYY